MTTVFYREYYDGHLIIAEGHCGYSEKGSDIVCAAVSALILALRDTLEEESSAHRVRIIRNIIRDGYVCLEYSSYDFSEERISGITDACITGLRSVAGQYPDNVVFV